MSREAYWNLREKTLGQQPNEPEEVNGYVKRSDNFVLPFDLGGWVQIKDGCRIEMEKPARPKPCGSGKKIIVRLVRGKPLNTSQSFFRFCRLPDRT